MLIMLSYISTSWTKFCAIQLTWKDNRCIVVGVHIHAVLETWLSTHETNEETRDATCKDYNFFTDVIVELHARTLLVLTENMSQGWGHSCLCRLWTMHGNVDSFTLLKLDKDKNCTIES